MSELIGFDLDEVCQPLPGTETCCRACGIQGGERWVVGVGFTRICTVCLGRGWHGYSKEGHTVAVDKDGRWAKTNGRVKTNPLRRYRESERRTDYLESVERKGE